MVNVFRQTTKPYFVLVDSPSNNCCFDNKMVSLYYLLLLLLAGNPSALKPQFLVHCTSSVGEVNLAAPQPTR